MAHRQNANIQGECVALNAQMHGKHGYQAAPLLGASVHGSSFFPRERAHRPFGVAKDKHFGAPRTHGGGPRRGGDASGKFR
jgi:hypothetical protein